MALRLPLPASIGASQTQSPQRPFFPHFLHTPPSLRSRAFILETARGRSREGHTRGAPPPTRAGQAMAAEGDTSGTPELGAPEAHGSHGFHLEAAVDAVRRACLLALQVRREFSGAPGAPGGSSGGVLEKGDRTPVTVADYAIQALITLELESRFPGVPLVGEEEPSDLSAEGGRALLARVTGLVRAFASARLGQGVDEGAVLRALGGAPNAGDAHGTPPASTYWVLDPIDGTRGFLQGGRAQYVVGLALVEDGRVVVGAMGLPNMPWGDNIPTSSTDAGSMRSGSTGSRGCEDGQSPSSEDGAEVREGDVGLVIAAHQGQGCWVGGLPLTTTSPQADRGRNSTSEETSHVTQVGPGTVSPEEALSGTAEARLAGGVPLWRCRVDSVGAAGRGATVCISDHEQWEDLPLAQGLRGSPTAGPGAQGPRVRVVPLCCGSLCKYAAVCLGRASVFIQHPTPLGSCHPLKVWDHAAGIICVIEAGGQVSDFDGKALDIGNGRSTFVPGGGGVVVSNGRVHNEVLDLIAP